MTKSRFITVLFCALALVAGALFWLRRQSTETLRAEIGLLREQKAEVEKLRGENARLKAAQISEEELKRLKADRSALLNLQNEIQRSRQAVEKQEKILTEMEADEKGVVLALTVNAAGEILAGGKLLDEESMRRQFASYARGSKVLVSIYRPEIVPPANTEKMLENYRTVSRQMVSVAKTLGLRMTVDLLPPDSAVFVK